MNLHPGTTSALHVGAWGAIVIALGVALPAMADHGAPLPEELALAAAFSTVSGTVESAAYQRLAIILPDGKTRSILQVAGIATITLNGEPAGLGDLKKGDAVSITVAEVDRSLALAVRAKR